MHTFEFVAEDSRGEVITSIEVDSMSEKAARRVAWYALSDAQRDACAQFECVDSVALKPQPLFTGWSDQARPAAPVSRDALARSIRSWRACGVQVRRYTRRDGVAYVVRHATGDSAVAFISHA